MFWLMLVKLGPGDGKRLRYRTFAVEKYEVAECIFGIVAALTKHTKELAQAIVQTGLLPRMRGVYSLEPAVQAMWQALL